MAKQSSILVLAEPSRMRDGLQALLETLWQGPILTGSDTAIISKAITETDQAVVLLDAALANVNVCDTLHWLKTTYPKLTCVALVDHIHQEQLAKTAGADAVLLKGFSTEQLYGVVNRISHVQMQGSL